jgi:lipoprotein-releasing system permease protein
MGYPLTVALRYLSSKKRSMISISTALAIGGVTLGVAALTIVMSVTGGFQEQFRDKVLGVNAHVLVLKYSIDYREYRDVMKKVEDVPHVIGVAPFVINPMMVTHGEHTATGVLLKGVDPALMPHVLNLPKDIVPGMGSLDGLRRPDSKPPERSFDPLRDDLDEPRAETRDGGSDSLLELMQKEVAEGMRRADAGMADEAGAAVAITPPTPPPQVVFPGAPHDLQPSGGYGSHLPDSDVLPDTIDPDPCQSPDQVAKLPGIVVGRTLARQLEVGLGDCVQVTSPQIGLSFGSGARSPIAKQFRVIAVFEAGFDQYDSKLVYTDLYEAQAFYEYGDSVTGIELKLDDIDRADAVAKEIMVRLNNGIYNTMTWRQLNHGLFTALLFQQIGMSFALGLIIVIAACTVIATLIMVVLEKKKEIALLKALGAKNHAILRIFLYQGAIIGTAGTALGLFIGWLCCWFLTAFAFPLDPKVYFISHLPISVHPSQFVLPAIIALDICIGATVLPALYGAEMRPADGLRGDEASEAGPWRLGELLAAAWTAFIARPWVLVASGAIVLLVVTAAVKLTTFALSLWLVLHGAASADMPAADDGVVRAGGYAAAFAVTVLLRAVLVCMWSAAAKGDKVRVGQALRALDRMVPYVAMSLLRWLLVGLGTLLCFIPGSIAVVATSLADYYVVEGRMGPVQALKASWEATIGGRVTLWIWLSVGSGAVFLLVLGLALSFRALTHGPIGLLAIVACAAAAAAGQALFSLGLASAYVRKAALPAAQSALASPPDGLPAE